MNSSRCITAITTQLRERTSNKLSCAALRSYCTSSTTSGNGTKDKSHSHYYNKRPTPVSLKVMLESAGGKPTEAGLMRAGRWILDEIPIRIAHQIRNMDKLPYGLCLMPSVRKVRKWYKEDINDLHAFPKILDFGDELKFAQLLKSILSKHSKTLIAMAKGLHELKRELSKLDDMDLDTVAVHQFLDEFYLSRIGLRMMVGQHLALHEQLVKPEKDFIGLICQNTSPRQVAQDAIHDARYMCVRSHERAPDVQFHGISDVTFPFVPSYLYYILFELLKNSMRATVEKHANAPNGKIPPINVVFAASNDNEDIAIKISDQGGGIKRSHYTKIWSYLYTTAAPEFDTLSTLDEVEDFTTHAPLAGLGCGLPLSRLYARYFGGDLQLISMEGYGTDVYLHLPRLGDKFEPLTQADLLNI